MEAKDVDLFASTSRADKFRLLFKGQVYVCVFLYSCTQQFREWVVRFGVAPFREVRSTARRNCAGKENNILKKFKDLNAAIVCLQAVLARSDAEPEQKKDVEKVIEQIKRLRRRPHCTPAESYRCVREVTERLLRSFLKR